MDSDDLDISIIEDDSSGSDDGSRDGSADGSQDGSQDGSDDGSFDYMQDREPLSEIDMFFIYINSDNAIDKVEKTVESIGDLSRDLSGDLSGDLSRDPGSLYVSGVSKERLLQIVQTKRTCHDKKYRLTEIMAFQIPLEYSNLESFIKGNDNIGSDCLQPIPIFNEVGIHPALYIFHDLTALYFFFVESMKPLKSVLRNGSENRSTKKVRINDDKANGLEGMKGLDGSPSLPYHIRKRKSLKRFLRRGNSTRKTSAIIVNNLDI
jgi:hypothetical protein